MNFSLKTFEFQTSTNPKVDAVKLSGRITAGTGSSRHPLVFPRPILTVQITSLLVSTLTQRPAVR